MFALLLMQAFIDGCVMFSQLLVPSIGIQILFVPPVFNIIFVASAQLRSSLFSQVILQFFDCFSHQQTVALVSTIQSSHRVGAMITQTPADCSPLPFPFPDICRVCRSEGSLDRPLFYPCICTGSIKYIHQECLIQWLRYSRKEYCELCNHRFSFTPSETHRPVLESAGEGCEEERRRREAGRGWEGVQRRGLRRVTKVGAGKGPGREGYGRWGLGLIHGGR